MADVKKGKDPECTMYDCPHKRELAVSEDELKDEKKKNQELNSRLESVDALIDQGLVDIKGLFTELFKGTDKVSEGDVQKIVNKIEKVFDTQKITEIVSDNLRLRKEIHQRDIKIMELIREVGITKQENHSLKDDVRIREELDKNIIKGMRNMEKQNEDQNSIIQRNTLTLKQQEQQLKVLEDFITNARETIKTLKEEHEYYLKEIKAVKNPKLTKEGKKVLNLIKKIKSLKNGGKWGFNRLLKRDMSYKIKLAYMELKDAYFGLADFEKQKLVSKYDEVAKMMGE